MVEPSTTSHRNFPSNDAGACSVNRNRDTDAGESIIRIHVEHGVHVSLNPLVVPAVALLFQDLVVNVSQMFPGWRMLSQVILASESRALS